MTDCVYKTKSGKRKQFDGGIQAITRVETDIRVDDWGREIRESVVIHRLVAAVCSQCKYQRK